MNTSQIIVIVVWAVGLIASIVSTLVKDIRNRIITTAFLVSTITMLTGGTLAMLPTASEQNQKAIYKATNVRVGNDTLYLKVK